MSKQTETQTVQTLSDQVKEYLPDPRCRIKLDDLINDEIRRFLDVINTGSFPVQGVDVTPTEFSDRLRRYNEITTDLITIVILLGQWANAEQRVSLEKIFARLADNITVASGDVAWIGLRWYPTLLLMYAGGISALAAKNYDNFSSILTSRIETKRAGNSPKAMIIPTVEGMLDVDEVDLFKTLPGNNRHYAPRSEHLFKVLEPILDDVLFLGTSYEQLFDRFEVLFALVYVDQEYKEGEMVLRPVGRFVSKYKNRMHATNPFDSLMLEAEKDNGSWAPLRAGLFKGSYKRFADIATGHRAHLDQLNLW